MSHDEYHPTNHRSNAYEFIYIDLAALLLLSSLLHLLQITATNVTVTIAVITTIKLSNYFATDHFAADN